MIRSLKNNKVDDIVLKKRVRNKLANRPIKPLDMDIISFCESLNLGLDGFTFESREFLKDILQDDSKSITILKSRQVGFSVLQAAIIAFYALSMPGIKIMYCSYGLKHMRYISKDLVRTFLKQHIDDMKRNEESVDSYFLSNGSRITLISGSNAFSQAKGYPINLLCIDEVEDLELEELPVILETQTASTQFTKTILGGTGSPEGTEWERIWKETDQKEWQNNQWIKQNDSNKSGYHITQKMMPFWSQEKEDEKRLQYNPLRFSTEVLGEFATGVSVPLDVSTVRKCLYDSAEWKIPNHEHTVIASIDLAQGGEADTVLTISEIQDKVHVLKAITLQDRLAKDLYSKIKPVLQSYEPNYIISDALGNTDLLAHIQEDYTVTIANMVAGSIPVTYKKGSNQVSMNKSFFQQRLIQRFYDKQISIPNVEPFIIDHLTADTSELIQKREGGSYIRYTKRPNRKDDFLMTLVFLECQLYMLDDQTNPNRKRKFWGFTTD